MYLWYKRTSSRAVLASIRNISISSFVEGDGGGRGTTRGVLGLIESHILPPQIECQTRVIPSEVAKIMKFVRFAAWYKWGGSSCHESSSE
jgi:hypothetical protein